jgi:hypothetical protein
MGMGFRFGEIQVVYHENRAYGRAKKGNKGRKRIRGNKGGLLSLISL